MMNLTNIWASALASALLVAGLSGCQNGDDTSGTAPAEKGPAEKVGEQLDQAAGEAAKHLNKMAEHAGKGLEKAGESLQGEAKDAQEQSSQANEAAEEDIPKKEEQK